jgi:hypothetical protein
MSYFLCRYHMAAPFTKQSKFTNASVGIAAMYIPDDAIMIS